LKLVAIIAFALPLPVEAAPCAHFGETVTLTGRYVLRAVALSSPGANEPNVKRTADLLDLDTPLCVADDDISEGVLAAGNVQVACPGLAAASHVSITGRLFEAHTGNGQTPVLPICQSTSATTH
jgi:hypothetical protein